MRYPLHGVLALLAGVVCATAPRDARAQASPIPVQAGVTLERDTVTIGDVVRLTVRVRAPKGATINFPAAVDSLGPVQALEPPAIRDGADSATAADRIAVYRMAAWDIGLQPIRIGDVLVQTDAGERRVALTLPPVFVRSVLPADTTLRMPKPARPLVPVRAPVTWWWWALAVAIALLLVGIAWWWIRRRNRGGVLTGDPYLEAMSAFDRVERLKLIDAGEPGRHAALMTDVVRRYLSARVAGVSLALTTRELLNAARGAATVSHEGLGALLEAVDPVKFARAPLDGPRARALGDAAKALVREEHQRAAALAAAAVTGKERAA